MEILQILNSAASKGQRPVLFIGGHAINEYGISRSTANLELLVKAKDLDFWRQLLVRLGYEVFHETSGFLQSKPGTPAAWPIDLILVSEATMVKALHDELSTDALGPTVQVASVGSLIAKKLHSLKFAGTERALKDQSDLLGLLDLAGVNTTSETFRQLCLRYAAIKV